MGLVLRSLPGPPLGIGGLSNNSDIVLNGCRDVDHHDHAMTARLHATIRKQLFLQLLPEG